MGVVKFKNRSNNTVVVREYICLGAGTKGKLLSKAASPGVIPIYGCKDPAATNYDPTATHDNGTCTYPAPVLGCTNPAATNYNPAATQDNGTCTFAPPAEGTAMFSEAYKQEFLKRSKGLATKNFRTNGDVAPNSPGEWTRISTATNRFKSKWAAIPGYNVFTGKALVTNPPASDPQTPNPLGFVIKANNIFPDLIAVADMHAAAFTYWLYPTIQTVIKDYVKAYLIAQTSQEWFDFSNRTRWKIGEIGDLPPGYYNCQVIAMMVSAMEFIGFDKFDGYDTPNDLTTEFGKVKKWFLDAADYYRDELHADLKKLFSAGTVRNGDFSQYVFSSTGSALSDNKRFNSDTELNKSINKFYNNRRGDIAVGVSHVGNAFGYQPAISAAEVYYLESLAFYCFAKDLHSGELERSTVTSELKGAKGWQYIANTYNQLSTIAWFNYRKGGTLKDREVTFGVGSDNDPTKPKTLPKLMAAFCQIRSREVTFYCYNDTGNAYPIRPDVPDIYNGYQDVGFALASIMFPVSTYPVEGAKIKASAYAFPAPLPSAITPGKTRPVDGNGSYSVHQGPGGTFVSCMFCWGYMDGIPIV